MSWLKRLRKKRRPEEVQHPILDFREGKLFLNEQCLTFPLSLEDLKASLGAPDKTEKDSQNRLCYVYDRLGLVFVVQRKGEDWYKRRQVYIDQNHNITLVNLYFGDEVREMVYETVLPAQPCQTVITINGRPLSFISQRAQHGDFQLIYWAPYDTKVNGSVEKLIYPLSIAFLPELPRQQSPISKDESLLFSSLNLKLAVIQELMYNQCLLLPKFDLREYAEKYPNAGIDLESQEAVPAALRFFAELAIPQSLAEKVTSLDMDGGNVIYGHIIPQWDGEDGYFSLNAVTESELKQFPNLKEARIMAEDYENIANVFKSAGISVE
ncbi:DUF6892 domain-containing protein [Streptococcus rifensis]